VGHRGRLRNLLRRAEGEYDALLCRECGERFKVAADTDLEYIAHEWSRHTGNGSYRETPPDVFRVVAHEHGEDFWVSLVYESTGEPWPEMVAKAQRTVEEARRSSYGA
jgi:hypothetical protein